VAGKYSDQGREVHISSDSYATEGGALEYAIEDMENLLKSLHKSLDEVYVRQEESRVRNVAQMLAMLTEDDFSSIVDLRICRALRT
jgi:hypothetical protein